MVGGGGFGFPEAEEAAAGEEGNVLIEGEVGGAAGKVSDGGPGLELGGVLQLVGGSGKGGPAQAEGSGGGGFEGEWGGEGAGLGGELEIVEGEGGVEAGVVAVDPAEVEDLAGRPVEAAEGGAAGLAPRGGMAEASAVGGAAAGDAGEGVAGGG